MKHIAAAICLVLLALSAGCSVGGKKYTEEYYDLFDTYVAFTAYAKSESEFKTYADAVHGEMLRLHRLFDIYNDYEGLNNLKTVNDNAGISPVKLDPSMIELIEEAISAYRYTDGAVNIALGPVLRIWHDFRATAPETTELPSYEDLSAASELASIQDVVIDSASSTVFLRRKGMSLDAGAIAKGYAVREAIEAANRAGMTSGLLNAGGDVCAVGKPGDGRDKWIVAIRSPEESGGSFATLGINDFSVVTSGDYERFFIADGVRLHHIIDPATLYPTKNARSVTVIHPDAMTADVLSTAAFILPYERAAALVEIMGGEAVWILPDGSVYSTKGYDAYLISS